MAATDTTLLLDAKQAAALCCISRAVWYRQLSAGRIPSPAKIGKLSRWRRDELERWIVAGCPARDKWERMG